MPRAKKIIQLDDEIKVIKKKKTIKLKKSKQSKQSKQIITKDMIAETAYYKAEQRGFNPGHEERDWLEAEIYLKSELNT